MKAVLLSIKPKYCELIESGKKTVEVRKTRPKLDIPFKVYIYETKGYDTLFGKDKPKKLCVSGGRVIGEFVCDEILDCRDVDMDDTCLTVEEWLKYTKGHRGIVYGWHISDLVIYDKPKELSEFYRKCDKIGCDDCEHFDYEIINDDEFEFECEYFCRTNGCIPITRPPQSWFYVEEVKNSDNI